MVHTMHEIHGDQNPLQIFSKSLQPGKFHMHTKKDALESYLLSFQIMSILGINVKFQGG